VTDWYVSAANYAAAPQWGSLTMFGAAAYQRGLATPNQSAQQIFYTALGGLSGATEPAWNDANNGTTSDGSITWTNVTGQSWTYAAGSCATLCGNNQIPHRPASSGGDFVWLDSSHSETATTRFIPPSLCKAPTPTSRSTRLISHRSPEITRPAR